MKRHERAALFQYRCEGETLPVIRIGQERRGIARVIGQGARRRENIRSPPALPGSEKRLRRVVSLPCYPEMTMAAAERMDQSCEAWFEKTR